MRSRTLMFIMVAVVPSLPLFYIIATLSLQHRDAHPNDSASFEGLPSQLLLLNKALHEVRPPVRDSLQGPQQLQPPLPIDLHTFQASDIDSHTIQLSENPDIDVRAKFQRERISEMCSKYFFSHEKRLPSNERLPPFFRHLMFDDNRKAIFCYVPKIGCTDMKRLMLYMGGHLPLNTVDWPWVEDHIYLEPALAKVSLSNKTLSLSGKIARLKTYYKFMIVRNPLERLVSAFRNKLEPPLSHQNQDKFPERIKAYILEQYRSSELGEWRRSLYDGNRWNISVTFTEFVHHFLETDVTLLNDHFRPMIDISLPCVIKYNFYGNFRNFSSDVKQLIERFKTEPRFYRDKSLHSSTEQTSQKLEAYYRRLSHRDRVRLLGKMHDDLLFYYTLYPADRYSHYQLLGIKHPII